MSDAHTSEPTFRSRTLDRLRLQFLSAGDWKAALADSGLPDGVTNIVRDVVQKTGLLRFEKSEITTELIHHFQDGHQRGHSFEDLVRDFGKPDVAVSLFRSSKLRSRPMLVKAFRGTSMVMGGGLIGYLLLQLFFHSVTPNPSVDYSVKLNEAVTSMPVQEQAWPLYRDVWAKHGFVEDGSSYDELWTDKKLRLMRPTDEGWDKATAKLDSLEELLAVFRKGAKLPYLGTPLHIDQSKYSDRDLAVLFPGSTREEIESRSISEDFGLSIDISEEAQELLSQSMVRILLPHIQQCRRAARVLRVDMRYAMQQDDHDRAIENIETTFGLGKQVGNSPLAVCTLVGLAVQDIGFDMIQELTEDHFDSLSDEELKRLQDVAANVDFASLFTDMSVEKDCALDLLQRTYSDDGSGDGRMTAVGLEVRHAYLTNFGGTRQHDGMLWFANPMVRSIAGPATLVTAPSRREVQSGLDEVFQEIEKAAQRTMWQSFESDFDLEELLMEKDESGFLLGMTSAFDNLILGREVRIARQDAVLLALAIHRFKRSEREWPQELGQLTGGWIDRTPIDRINGKPLHFTIKDDALVVYSIGHDGVDDRGVKSDAGAPWLVKDSDGDWVLWPQEK